MADNKELLITLDGGRRVTAHVGGHEIHTDQPVSNGGQNSAPSPFDVFLASLGACAGLFVQGFCAARDIESTGIRLHEWPRYDGSGALRGVELAIELPVNFPARYHEALLRVVEQCTVKRAIAGHPELMVRISASTSSPALSPVVAH
jgi:putative redox protein